MSSMVVENLIPLAIALGLTVFVFKYFSSSSSSSKGKQVTQKASRAPLVDEKPVRFVVGTVNELKDGEMKEVKLEDGAGTVLLTRENGKYNCTGSKCTHSSARLVTGVLHNGRVRCPWHGACFSTETGDIEEMPGVDSLHSYPVDVEGTNLVIEATKSSLKENWKRKPSLCSRNARNKKTFVIVGAGSAGFTCAETLRKEGFTGRIVLVGKEAHAPYDRTKLSKSMSLSIDKIQFRPDSYFEDAKIETMFGVEVTEVDAKKRVVFLANGDELQYDKCFFATGGAARTLNCPGSDLPQVFPLRVPEDASKILSLCTKDTKLVIVGSSFIGMETAAYLHDKVSSVDVIGMESVPFERVLGAEIGGALQKLHETKGKIRFHMKRVVKEFLSNRGHLSGVELDDGTTLLASLVVMGAGVIPSTQALKEHVQKERDQSIVADEYLCAHEHLYVGGDIARFPYHRTNNSLVRIEHYGMAQFHGKVAALNMMGKQVVNDSIPFFWTSQYGKSVRYCGHALRYDNIIIDGDLDKLEFVAYFCSEGAVLAVASLGRDPVVSTCAELMGTDEMLTEKQLFAEIKKHGRVTLKGRFKK